MHKICSIRRTVFLSLFLVPLFTFSVAATDYLSVVNQNSGPTRIAKGPSGKIFVTDTDVNSLFIYDSYLNVTGELKDLNLPLGVVVAPDGRIFIGSDGDNKIWVYNQDGSIFGAFGDGLISKPNDLALDFSNNLYVADSAANRITIFDNYGNLKNQFGTLGTNDGEFNFPIGVAVAYKTNGTGHADGEIFVADQQNFRIQVFDLDGNFVRKFGSMVSGSFSFTWKGRFLALQDIEVDDQYRAVTLDSYPSSGPSESNAVQVLDAYNGDYIISYGWHGSSPGEVNLPLGMVITDANGLSNNIIIANNGNETNEVLFSLPLFGEVLLSNTVIDEQVTNGTLVGSLSVTPDPGAPTFLLTAGPDGRDNSYFTIVGTNLFTAEALNYEEQAAYNIRIKGLFDGTTNLTHAFPFIITLNDVNDTPTVITIDNQTIAENNEMGTVVGAFQATDEDAGDTHAFTLVSGPGDTGNASFSISGSNLLSAAIFDEAAQSSYSIRIAGEDSGGGAITSIFSITILSANAIGEADQDGDGMPDWYEYDNTGDYISFVAGDDTDSDGTDNLYEYIALTDPWSGAQVFIVENKAYNANRAPIISWPSSDQRAYDIDWAPDITTPFTPLASDVPPTPPLNTYTDVVHAGMSTMFYRINVKLVKP